MPLTLPQLAIKLPRVGGGGEKASIRVVISLAFGNWIAVCDFVRVSCTAVRALNVGEALPISLRANKPAPPPHAAAPNTAPAATMMKANIERTLIVFIL